MYNTWNRERRKWSGAAALLAKNFQLGDGFQILGAARRALDLNQSVQTEATTRNPEDREIDAIGKQGLVASPVRDLAEQIETPHGGREGEIQPPPDGLCITLE